MHLLHLLYLIHLRDRLPAVRVTAPRAVAVPPRCRPPCLVLVGDVMSAVGAPRAPPEELGVHCGPW
jgi:hypothetical protein